MNRRIFTSLLIIGMVLAAMTGATLAYFTDVAESEPSTFQAGTLLIGLEGPDYGDFNISNLNPGDKWCTYIWVVNDGTKNMKFQGCIFGVEEWTGQNDANPNDAITEEMRGILIAKDYGNTVLSEGANPLQITVYLPLDPDNGDVPTYAAPLPDGYEFHEFSAEAIAYFKLDVTENLCCEGTDTGFVIYQGTLQNGQHFGEHFLPNNPLAPGEAIQYKICFEFPSEAGNEYQGAAIRGKFGFAGAQWLAEADYGVCGD